MSHKRTEIRKAIVAQLKDKTSAGANVFGSRSRPLWDVPYPAILIYMRDEASDPLHISDQSLKRHVKMAVEIRTQANDDIDDVLDSLAKEVEDIVDADDTFLDNALSSGLVATEIDVFEEGEVPIGALRLTYDVKYLTK